FGSWAGATVMYWGSRLIGRPLVLRYGHYFLVPPEKVEAAERWAAHYGPAGVFISRLLPVVRHLVGIPFGIVRMNYWRYSLYTLLGSGLWCAVLTYVGIAAGNDQALMAGNLHRITLWIVGMLTVLGLLYYFFVHRVMRRKVP
ncbi:MAG: DedA family protein, partial [Nevskiales bacterium]